MLGRVIVMSGKGIVMGEMGDGSDGSDGGASVVWVVMV